MEITRGRRCKQCKKLGVFRCTECQCNSGFCSVVCYVRYHKKQRLIQEDKERYSGELILKKNEERKKNDVGNLNVISKEGFGKGVSFKERKLVEGVIDLINKQIITNNTKSTSTSSPRKDMNPSPHKKRKTTSLPTSSSSTTTTRSSKSKSSSKPQVKTRSKSTGKERTDHKHKHKQKADKEQEEEQEEQEEEEQEEEQEEQEEQKEEEEEEEEQQQQQQQQEEEELKKGGKKLREFNEMYRICKEGTDSEIERLLAVKGRHIFDIKNKLEQNIMHLVSADNNTKVLVQLIDRIEVIERIEKDHFKAGFNPGEQVRDQYLNVQTRRGWTPLHYAAKYKANEAWYVLNAAGANKFIRNDDDQTAYDFHLAKGKTSEFTI